MPPPPGHPNNDGSSPAPRLARVRLALICASPIVIVLLVLTVWQWSNLQTSKGTVLAAWIAVVGVAANNWVIWTVEQERQQRARLERNEDWNRERMTRFLDHRRAEYQQCLHDVRNLAEAEEYHLKVNRSPQSDALGHQVNAAAMAWMSKILLVTDDTQVVHSARKLVGAGRSYRTARRAYYKSKGAEAKESRDAAEQRYKEAKRVFVAAAWQDLGGSADGEARALGQEPLSGRRV